MSEDAKRNIKGLLLNKELYGRIINPSEAYQKALGELTISFSMLHFLLERMGWELWGLSIPSRDILTKDLRVTHLVEKLRASADFASAKADQTKFLSLLKRAGKAADKRNELLHSLWIIEEGKPVFCVSRKRGALPASEVPSMDDIQKFNTSVFELAVAVASFRVAHSKHGLNLSSE